MKIYHIKTRCGKFCTFLGLRSHNNVLKYECEVFIPIPIKRCIIVAVDFVAMQGLRTQEYA